MKAKQPSANDLLDRLRAAQSGAAEKVPHGWHTTRELAVRWNLSESHTRKLVEKGAATGLLEVRKFRTQQTTRVLAIPHYRERPTP